MKLWIKIYSAVFLLLIMTACDRPGGTFLADHYCTDQVLRKKILLACVDEIPPGPFYGVAVDKCSAMAMYAAAKPDGQCEDLEENRLHP